MIILFWYCFFFIHLRSNSKRSGSIEHGIIVTYSHNRFVACRWVTAQVMSPPQFPIYNYLTISFTYCWIDHENAVNIYNFASSNKMRIDWTSMKFVLIRIYNFYFTIFIKKKKQRMRKMPEIWTCVCIILYEYVVLLALNWMHEINCWHRPAL